MRGPSHNAKLPFPIMYRGVAYSGFRQLMVSLVPSAPVSWSTVSGRLHRLIHNGGSLSDEVLDEIFYTDASAFQAKYGKRVTWMETENGRRKAEELYAKYASHEHVKSYSVFRTRLKSLEKRSIPITQEQLDKAAFSTQADWITDHGGGRRKKFVYDGELYPDHRGGYSAFTSFLKAIDRYSEREMLHARLKAKWAIDDILAEPPMSDGAPGYICRITDRRTGKAYVGLTVNRPEIRLGQHFLMAAKGGASLLHQAMRDGEPRNFALDVLEVVEGGEGRLAEREIEWMAVLGTLHPKGLNTRAGGQIGSYVGRPAEWDGRHFRSVALMRRVLSKETGLPEHVIESHCHRKLAGIAGMLRRDRSSSGSTSGYSRGQETRATQLILIGWTMNASKLT